MKTMTYLKYGIVFINGVAGGKLIEEVLEQEIPMYNLNVSQRFLHYFQLEEN